MIKGSILTNIYYSFYDAILFKSKTLFMWACLIIRGQYMYAENKFAADQFDCEFQSVLDCYLVNPSFS